MNSHFQFLYLSGPLSQLSVYPLPQPHLPQRTGSPETVSTEMRRINDRAALLGSHNDCAMKGWHSHVHCLTLLSIKEFPALYSYSLCVPEVVPSNLFMAQSIALLFEKGWFYLFKQSLHFFYVK